MPPETTTNNVGKKILILIVVVLAILFGFGGGRIFESQQIHTNQVSNDSQTQTELLDVDFGLEDNFLTKDDIKGYLVLSGLTLNENLIHSYTLSLEDQSASFIKRGDTLPLTGFVKFTNSNEPDAAFLRTISAASSKEEVKERIHFYDTKTKELKFFKNADGINPRNYDWSEVNNLLAYNQFSKAVSPGSIEFVEIENYEVVIFSPTEDKVIKTITKAMQPHWSMDGNFLIYLRDNGIYVFELATNKEILLTGFTADGDATNDLPVLDANSMIEVSADSKTLIWSNGPYGKLYVYGLSLSPVPKLNFKGKIIDTNEIEYYWPTISSDGRFYAVQAINHATDPMERTNPRIEIRAINGRNILATYPLADFNFNALFFDDWIATVPEF